MPLFLFHLRTPDGLDRDDLGVEFESLEAAYLDVCVTIQEMAADYVRQGVNPLPFAFVIADAAEAELMEVPFAERLRDGRAPVRPEPRPEVPDLVGDLQRGRQLVAAMRAEVVAMTVGVAEGREAARRAWALLRACR
ncbi:hypothetical protein Q8W71_29560 [Methylobacterium sp. NEAU 140]|uniref:DUF6894 family protein n=1 Tax=Methylobacterium sp. NEAU 140 TaxID=3064945 RepID=UPI00273595D7|nr:hypothetical protein [Methylobacterium sp. NEAU 140]MDP4026757.1 hypothetical protein [Methylobacterium sp. NEAU 140]